MNASIFYVGGSKGGVGKSKLSFALIDYLLDDGKKVLLLRPSFPNISWSSIPPPEATRGWKNTA